MPLPNRAAFRSAARATTPAVAAVLLLAVAATLAGVTGAVLFGAAESARPSAPPAPVSLSASASASADRVTLVHEAGPTLDVRTLTLRVAVAGAPLVHQPPVPFFAARGFRSGPTGPFNSAADPRWSAGEAASFELAGTNAPALAPGDEVAVRVYVDGSAAATVRTHASAGDGDESADGRAAVRAETAPDTAAGGGLTRARGRPS